MRSLRCSIRSYACYSSIDAGEYGFKTPIDPISPLHHDYIVVHSALDALEVLSDPFVTPGSEELIKRVMKLKHRPFVDVMALRSDFPHEEPSLFMLDNEPYASVLQKPNDEIVFMNLVTQQISSMVCVRDPAFDDLVSLSHSVSPITTR